METKKKQKSITVNLIANGIKTLMSVLFPLITFPYASRILGTAGIGKVNYASSIISYFAMFAALGINTYAVREGARIRDDKEKFSKFAQEILNINLVTTVVSYMALFVFLRFPVLDGYKKLLIICSVGIVFTTIGMEWLFVIKEEYAYITKRAVLFQFISLCLLFLMVKSKDDYCKYAALSVISSGGSAILNLWHSRKIVDWRMSCLHEYKKHLMPILLIFGTSVASSIYMTMDTTMLGAMRGDDATGIYTAAVKINSVVSTLIGTVSSTILPRVSYYIGNGLKKEYERLMKSSVDMLLMIAMPTSIGMMCTSDILILLFSGSEFLAGSLAAKILSAKVVIGAVNRILAYQICIPHKKDKDVLISTICGAVFNLIANAILIPRFGVTGASVATLFSEVVVLIVLTYYSSRFFATRSLYTRGPVYLLASVWFFAVRYMMDCFMSSIPLILINTVLICIVGYFVILILIKDPYLKGLMEQFFQRLEKIKKK
ncbi:MAG: oligosaccharide flippase family protein [Eubacteriales bacterium]|nr:oligosaccharide flippase family protein [Eubacteriales bacterium]